jgi:2-dehydro-3-deoxyphosphogluconate aldolase/(4S)-4-hydroxy-2-oxoglutarate aldolase
VNAVEQLAAQRLLPVIRCGDAEDAVATALAAARTGLRLVELTMTTPDVFDALRELAINGEVVPGLGTLNDSSEIGTAVSDEARFVVSFRHPKGFVHEAHQHGVPAIPAAFTPDEAARCHESGADLIKLFPARRLEPAYLHDLRPILPDVRYVVTGGIEPTSESMCPWFDAGALAVGVGTPLGTVASVGVEEVESRCRAALDAVRDSSTRSAA